MVIIGVGLLFLAPAILMGYSLWSFIQEAGFAQGAVMALTKRADGLDAPKVLFNVANQKKSYTFQSNTYSHNRYAIGDKVDVIYELRNPHNAAVYNVVDQWGSSILFGILGTPFFLMGVYMLLMAIIKPSPRYRYTPPTLKTGT